MVRPPRPSWRGVATRGRGAGAAAPPDLVHRLDLGVEEGARDLAGDVRRADVDPGVFVHLAPEELRPVRPLVAEDLRPVDQRGVVDAERAALAAGEVLRIVEAV